jgi:protease-4
VAGWLASRPAPLPTDAALLIAPNGQLVEQRSVQAADEPAAGRRRHSSGAAARRGRRDPRRRHRPRIKALVIETDGLSGAGLAKLEEIAAAIAEFRKAGKKVYAWGKHFDQAQYHLAAHADEVFLNPTATCCSPASGAFPPTSRACSTRPA